MISHLRQIQRRQILTMMGVTPWISSQTPTCSIDEVLAAAAAPVTIEASTSVSDGTDRSSAADIGETKPATFVSDAISPVQNGADVAAEVDRAARQQALEADSEISGGYFSEGFDEALVGDPSASVKTLPSQGNAAKDNSAKDNPAEVKPTAAKSLADLEKGDLSPPIAAFTLQGIGFNGWVLLVDKSQLQPQAQQLWQQMQLGLSLSAEQLTFPFCQSMCTQDMANASLAGFIFKLGRSDQVQVAALTELTEGLDDERLVRLPLLEEMVRQPSLKRQLWQILCHSST